MNWKLPKDPFLRIKFLAVEAAATIIFVYFVGKEVVDVLGR